MLDFILDSAAATEALGARLAHVLTPGCILYLRGDLGAGKTTLVRGLLHGLGYPGIVKSPTYTLVEPYAIGKWRLFHWDLYRLADPEELEYLGLREQLDGETALLIEWPERGPGELPPAIRRYAPGRMAAAPLSSTVASSSGDSVNLMVCVSPAGTRTRRKPANV